MVVHSLCLRACVVFQRALEPKRWLNYNIKAPKMKFLSMTCWCPLVSAVIRWNLFFRSVDLPCHFLYLGLLWWFYVSWPWYLLKKSVSWQLDMVFMISDQHLIACILSDDVQSLGGPKLKDVFRIPSVYYFSYAILLGSLSCGFITAFLEPQLKTVSTFQCRWVAKKPIRFLVKFRVKLDIEVRSFVVPPKCFTLDTAMLFFVFFPPTPETEAKKLHAYSAWEN